MSIKKILYRICVLVVAFVSYFIIVAVINNKNTNAKQSQNVIVYENNKNSVGNEIVNNEKLNNEINYKSERQEVYNV